MPSDASDVNDSRAECASVTPGREAHELHGKNNIRIGGCVDGNFVVGNHNVLGDAVVFVGTALGAGIVGNAAYDALKLSLTTLFRRAGNDTPYLGHERERFAREAVRQRCIEVDFPAPGPDEPCHVEWDEGHTDYTYHLTFRHVVAKVRIPKGPLAGQDLEVILQSHADRYDLARARLEVEQRRLHHAAMAWDKHRYGRMGPAS